MGDTWRNVRPSIVWLATAASLSLLACYAEVPGRAVDDSAYQLPDGGIGGNPSGGTAGGGMGGDPDSGLSVADGGTDLDGSTPPNCDGLPVGTAQARKRYEQAQILASETCTSETQTRTCRASGWTAWSGSFQADSCAQAPQRSCGAIEHGADESRERYPSELVDDVDLCVSETQTRTCNDGSFDDWTGTAQFESCTVDFLGKCNPLSSAFDCVAGTTCPIRFNPTCVGTAGHNCSANAECQSGVCVGGACLGAKVAAGGTCDEAGDCAACSSTTASVAATCTTGGICACGNGAICLTNAQCQGTCVALRCVTANTTCDNDEDCTPTTGKCVKSSGSSTGTCLLKNGALCTANAQCENVCRPSEANELFDPAERVCANLGGADKHCDENVDCQSGFVCRHVDTGPHCEPPLGALQSCEETADCDQTTPTSCIVVTALGRVCFPLSGNGSACSADNQCASGTCNIPMGSPTGTCSGNGG